MLVKRGKLYTLNSLDNFKNLVCTFPTTEIGDIGDEKVTEELSSVLKIDREGFVKAEQIHAGEVKVVTKEDANKVVKGCDGLFTKQKNVFLMVLVADCLPIVAFDPKKEIVGIAHAGWRSTVAKIAETLITRFKKIGSEPKNILIGFGPCIEFCHYEVGKEVVNQFNKVGLKDAILKSASGKFFVDLKQANTRQLIKAGIAKSNIDLTLKACTFEDSDFYSYRRDKTDKRFAAVVGMKDEA